jgi:hypothetical protein
VKCVWIATGNNPLLSRELARRVVRIRIASEVERPSDRTGFKHENLKQWALEHRGELVWAALTLIRNWQAKGSPRPEQPSLGSFESWSAVLGGILSSAGGRCFLTNASDTYDLAEDEDEGNYETFIFLWWQRHADVPMPASALLDLAAEAGILSESMQSDGKARAVSMGRRLSGMRGRVFDLPTGNVRVVQQKESHNIMLWRLMLL